MNNLENINKNVEKAEAFNTTNTTKEPTGFAIGGREGNNTQQKLHNISHACRRQSNKFYKM